VGERGERARVVGGAVADPSVDWGRTGQMAAGLGATDDPPSAPAPRTRVSGMFPLVAMLIVMTVVVVQTMGNVVPFVVFIAAGLVMAWTQGAFFRALARRDATAFRSDDEVMQEFANPSRILSVMVDASTGRLGALSRSSPYPEVERLRRLTLLAVAAVIAELVLVAVGR
jgi:hypothetical protein